MTSLGIPHDPDVGLRACGLMPNLGSRKQYMYPKPNPITRTKPHDILGATFSLKRCGSSVYINAATKENMTAGSIHDI